MTVSRSRLFMSGDWWLLGSWITAAVAGLLVSNQPGVTEDLVRLLTFAVLVIAVASCWIVGRIIRRPLMQTAPRPRGMGAMGVGVIVFLGWGVAFLVLASLGGHDPLAPVPSLIAFCSGWQMGDLVGRAVDLRTEGVSATKQPGV